MTVEKTHQYRPGLFVVMSLGLTWFWWALAITVGGADEKVETYAFKTVTLAFSLIGLLAPTITAVSLIVRSRDRSLIADFLDRIVNVRRISPRYLIVTLLLPPAAMCLAIGLSLLVGESTDQFRLTVDTSQIGKLVTMVVLTMILAPILEEMGWRGYGVDSFRARMGMLKGTLAFGVLLSVWHAPLTLIPGSYHYGLA
ncbi:MAG: CPBP family intramembrane metalloprotease, partial [Gemmatimonadetes bacterium]|nr:CPBP family intramembrane metalloprotease [Gemmatimonadota bacterium]